jgi:hypothetical protein
MNDFQALLIFVTAMMIIATVMIMLHQRFVSNLNKNTKNKTKNYKRNLAHMKMSGIDLINEELAKRKIKRQAMAENADSSRTFVVYDTTTGESFNYYEKKR